MNSLNIGVRAHDYAPGTPEQVAQEISRHHPVSCVQLAPAKSFPFIEQDNNRLDGNFAAHVARTFADRNLSIGVLGCYINPIHPDPALREASLQWFERHLALATAFNCNIVGTETGSRHADCTFHPDNRSDSAFEELITSVRRLADTAEKYNVLVGIEGVAHHHIIHTPERMTALIRAVNSPNVKVIYDPVNLFPQHMETPQEEELQKCFDMLGRHIIAVHSKDYVLNNHKKEGDLPSGTGYMNHRLLFDWILNNAPDIPVILENTCEENLASVLSFIRSQTLP